MKTVYSSTREVCAAWAAQEQPTARTGSNTSFRNQTLYSYGTPIAEIVRCPKGGDIADMTALISRRQWSSGTSKVQGEAWGEARRAGYAVFRVAHLGAESASANIGDYEARIDEAVEKIERAVRWDTARDHRREAMALIGECALFARTFGIPWAPIGRNPMLADGKDRSL